MGTRVDGESDGQPDPNAEGDDNNALPDEDGVVFMTVLRHGQPAAMEITVSTYGWLDAWFDWDRSGSWDVDESVFSDNVAGGVDTIAFVVPQSAGAGRTFARFRFNSYGPLPVDGPAYDGEVEDYAVVVEADFGDAPDPSYPTLLASNGAWHAIDSTVFMGDAIDGDPDGQPDPNAWGDDFADFPDDEDGVFFTTPFSPGLPAALDVKVSENGWLDVWFDWDLSGSWDAGESVYSDLVWQDFNTITFVVPADAWTARTFARFRYNTVGPLPVDGPAADGEVEDYEVFVEHPIVDFGDAPDPGYPTLLASNGAWHLVDPNVYLGYAIDADSNEQPHPNALGDDLAGIADEDGVVFVTPLVLGQTAQVDVTMSESGWLNVWFDWNQNGSWEWDWDESVYSEYVEGGFASISFYVPSDASLGQTFARFRFNTVSPLSPYGGAFDGEVEDYEVVVEPFTDYGDAPDPSYPTLLAGNGARHNIVWGVFMGSQVDGELDGQPHPNALGDDLSQDPDEDGVVFITPLMRGQEASAVVVVSLDGWLDAWFDWDRNGFWSAGESVYSGPVTAGADTIAFTVPAGDSLGYTFARFRYNTVGPLPVDGLASNGEVEDYEVLIEAAPELDFGDAPDPGYPTLLANNGARHTIVQDVFMGGSIDAEADGQPHPNAQGDDLANLADEDGVVFASPLVINQNAQVDVTVSVAGWLDAWFDWDRSGAWDAFELVYSGPVAAGSNPISFIVPAVAVPGQTFGRFRYSTGAALPLDGPAPDGEVEDYEVIIEDETTDVKDQAVPDFFELHDAAPNPFNPQTTLSFSLPTACHVRLAIFDVRGRLVATLLDEERGPGLHRVVWDGRNARGRQVASGVYLYRLEAGSFIEAKPMVLLK
jgi:hypothetical protein